MGMKAFSTTLRVLRLCVAKIVSQVHTFIFAYFWVMVQHSIKCYKKKQSEDCVGELVSVSLQNGSNKRLFIL